VVKKALDMQIKNNGKNNPIYPVILSEFFGSGSSGLGFNHTTHGFTIGIRLVVSLTGMALFR